MYDFIIIDDDWLNNVLCSEMIQSMCPHASVKTFVNPATALAFMRSCDANPRSNTTVVFLDIEMPVMTGWDVLEEFHTFSEEVKDQFEIFILSSFIYTRRKPDSVLGEYIAGYIAKPLTKFILQETVQQKHEFFV